MIKRTSDKQAPGAGGAGERAEVRMRLRNHRNHRCPFLVWLEKQRASPGLPQGHPFFFKPERPPMSGTNPAGVQEQDSTPKESRKN